MKVAIEAVCKVTTEKRKAINAVYLLIVKYISITLGLYYDFISAWRSGKKPSPNSETNKRKQLMKVRGWSTPPSTALK